MGLRLSPLFVLKSSQAALKHQQSPPTEPNLSSELLFSVVQRECSAVVLNRDLLLQARRNTSPAAQRSMSQGELQRGVGGGGLERGSAAARCQVLSSARIAMSAV